MKYEVIVVIDDIEEFEEKVTEAIAKGHELHGSAFSSSWVMLNEHDNQTVFTEYCQPILINQAA